MILIIISTVITITFLLTARIRYGMTRSWSAIYYELKRDGIAWLFPVALGGFSIPLILATWGSSAFAIAGTMIVFSGLAADAQDNEITEQNHVIGATGGMIMAGFGFVLWNMWWIAGAMLLGSLAMYIIQFKNHTYFIELYVYIITILGLILSCGLI